MKSFKNRIVAIITVLSLLPICFVNAKENNKEGVPSEIEIYPELETVLQELKEEDTLEVYVWMADIEVEQIKDNIQKNILGEVSMEEASDDIIQSYIEKSRDFLSKEYIKSNTRIIEEINNYCGKIEVKFVSKYAPMCIIKLTKEQISKLYHIKHDVVALDIYRTLPFIQSSNVANSNSGASYVRDTLGYTGNGIKIGMIETGSPLAISSYNSFFNVNKIHILGTCADATYEENLHATRVAAIMVGSGTTCNSIYYQGVVPSADLYCIGCKNIDDFFDGIEALIDNGVNVINMSGGFTPSSAYNVINLWVDHIAYKDDVHFVMAAGNNRDSTHRIDTPGLSYNIVTVGAYNDNNNLIDSSGPSTLYGQTLSSSLFQMYTNSSYLEGSANVCKPDLVASGVNISYANLPNTYNGHPIDSGTSFAAPQVTGVIAQLMQVKPALKKKQDQMKAILCASAIYRISGDQLEQSSGDPRYEYCLYEKQGAGILNARLARYIATTSGKAQSIYMYGNTSTTYTYNIYAYSSDIYLRFALCWLKRSNSDATPSASTYWNSSDTGDLADYDVTVTAPNGSIAYSNCSLGNMELIQLNTSEYGYGTYTITIHIKANNNITNYLGMAWY